MSKNSKKAYTFFEVASDTSQLEVKEKESTPENADEQLSEGSLPSETSSVSASSEKVIPAPKGKPEGTKKIATGDKLLSKAQTVNKIVKVLKRNSHKRSNLTHDALRAFLLFVEALENRK